MIISMIAAMSRNRVIGKNNGIPWHLPDDFRYFKKTTEGHHVLMGRKNFESLPSKYSPLPNRPNVIITRNKNYQVDDTQVVHSLEDGIDLARKAGESEAFIIGGGEIYKLGLDHAQLIYLTEIKGDIDGDTFFPELDKDQWEEISRVPHPTDERHTFAFDFVIYKKK